MVTVGEKIKSIPISEVAYFFGQQKYVFLITHDNRRYIVDYTLGKLEALLDPARAPLDLCLARIRRPEEGRPGEGNREPPRKGWSLVEHGEPAPQRRQICNVDIGPVRARRVGEASDIGETAGGTK